ncbi:MAG: hypothetical protein VX069_00630 [Cyanobacteriota bacterium]|nr:hypothetical protein [Cyanobacteriota bacterium]
MSTAPVRRPERRLRAVPSQHTSTRITPVFVYRGLVLVMLGLIAHAVAKPTALDRCIRSRYQQVLDSHQLSDNQITTQIRQSEFNKATNFCNGGTGRLSWSN